MLSSNYHDLVVLYWYTVSLTITLHLTGQNVYCPTIPGKVSFMCMYFT